MNRPLSKIIQILLITIIYSLVISCALKEEKKGIIFSKKDTGFVFENNNIRLVLDKKLNIEVFQKQGNQIKTITKSNHSTHYLVINGVEVKNFIAINENPKFSDINNESGKGKKLEIKGLAEGPSGSKIEKKIQIELYEKQSNTALVQVMYKNVNATPGLYIENEINNAFELDASLINNSYDKHDFWILQGGSYTDRPDWVLPVTENFSFQNYQGRKLEEGMVGGGLPVLDIWNQDTGFFIGSTREKPTLISLPAKVNDKGSLNVSIEYKRDSIPFTTEEYRGLPTVIGVHYGDYYNGLESYSAVMKDKGFNMPEPDSSSPAFDRIWCGWGYGPGFKMNQMTDMIPSVKSMGFKVVTIDYGWFYNNGDFTPRDDSFPDGDKDMKKLVKSFHDENIKLKLWITPGSAGPDLVEQHPEWLLISKDGSPTYVNDHLGEDRPEEYEEALLCPTLDEVKVYYKALTNKIIQDWGYDGLKMDFSFTNATGKCYAKEHNHKNPEESFEALPELYKVIYEESTRIKKSAILEMCPCGMFPSFYKMPYYNQPVSSDPNNQWQLRHRAKTIKALMGKKIPFYGDHVERYYNKNSFASMIGVGAIPGTMFVDKSENRFMHPSKSVREIALTPERKVNFDKWLKIHDEVQLSKGEYINLYDIAYDKPETHVVNKDGILHYAFYADNWNGEIEFRGLEADTYTVWDYANNKEVGKLNGNGKLSIKFKDYLLVKAIPNRLLISNNNQYGSK